MLESQWKTKENQWKTTRKWRKTNEKPMKKWKTSEKWGKWRKTNRKQGKERKMKENHGKWKENLSKPKNKKNPNPLFIVKSSSIITSKKKLLNKGGARLSQVSTLIGFGNIYFAVVSLASHFFVMIWLKWKSLYNCVKVSIDHNFCWQKKSWYWN